MRISRDNRASKIQFRRWSLEKEPAGTFNKAQRLIE
jgi:hypothetical protein